MTPNKLPHPTLPNPYLPMGRFGQAVWAENIGIMFFISQPERGRHWVIVITYYPTPC